MNRAERRIAAVTGRSPNRPAVVQKTFEMAQSYHKAGDLVQAGYYYEQVIAAEPDAADAWVNYAVVLGTDRQWDCGLAAGLRAVQLMPKHPVAHNTLGSCYARTGDAAKALHHYEIACRLDPTHWTLAKNLLNMAVMADTVSNADLALLHKTVAKRFRAGSKVINLASHFKTEPRLPKRIGILSSDLYDHVISGNLMPIIKALAADGSFEIYLYHENVKTDTMTSAFLFYSSKYRDISPLTDRQAAEQIAHDEIDILVSIAGRYDSNRPMICAYKPARIQVSMYDVATSGIPEMDYLIADAGVAPRQTDEWFTERIVHVPPIFVRTDIESYPPIRPNVHSEGAVFCCFGNPVRITPTCMRMWGQILARCKGSSLQLGYQDYYKSEILRKRVVDGLRENGAPADAQIAFHTDWEDPQIFLRRYNDVDIALDTFPASGSNTTFQSLAMGVPVVTLQTDRMASRWTASILEKIGDDFTVCDNEPEYITTAEFMAECVPMNRHLIRDAVERSILCDGDKFARRMVRVFKAMANDRAVPG